MILHAFDLGDYIVEKAICIACSVFEDLEFCLKWVFQLKLSSIIYTVNALFWEAVRRLELHLLIKFSKTTAFRAGLSQS